MFRIRAWNSNNAVRVLAVGMLLLFSYSTIFELSGLAARVLDRLLQDAPTWFFSAAWVTIGWLLAATIAAAGWTATAFLPSVATSLGYSKTPKYDVAISGDGNIVTVPSKSESHSTSTDTFMLVLAEKYSSDNVLSPLDNARFRLLDHISKLRNNSVTNLFIAIGIALIGIAILFTAVWQIDSFADRTNHTFDVTGFLTFGLIPRLSITIFIQIFSYFFLAMYRANPSEIRFFQNEITNLDSLASAIIVYMNSKNSANVKILLQSLSKTERNRVIKKSEKTINDLDDADVIRALAIASKINDASLGGSSTTTRKDTPK